MLTPSMKNTKKSEAKLKWEKARKMLEKHDWSHTGIYDLFKKSVSGEKVPLLKLIQY
jgi:hypothetical protein